MGGSLELEGVKHVECMCFRFSAVEIFIASSEFRKS